MGLTGPEGPLHVQSTSTGVTNFLILEGDRNSGSTEMGILFVDRSAVSGGQRAGRIWTQRISTTGNFDLVFQAGDQGLAGLQNESMRIHGDTGNVLIGTSTNSGYLLDVAGTLRATGAAYLDSHLTLRKVSGTPSSPASGTEGRMYIKGDKLIIVFNDGGTVRYKYLDLTGTGVTWVHTTTAP